MKELKLQTNKPLDRDYFKYKNNPNKDTKKDLDWARRALDEYYSGA